MTHETFCPFFFHYIKQNMKVKGPSEEQKAINRFTSIFAARSYYCSMCRRSFKAQGCYHRHLIKHKNNPHMKLIDKRIK